MRPCLHEMALVSLALGPKLIRFWNAKHAAQSCKGLHPLEERRIHEHSVFSEDSDRRERSSFGWKTECRASTIGPSRSLSFHSNEAINRCFHQPHRCLIIIPSADEPRIVLLDSRRLTSDSRVFEAPRSFANRTGARQRSMTDTEIAPSDRTEKDKTSVLHMGPGRLRLRDRLLRDDEVPLRTVSGGLLARLNSQNQNPSTSLFL